MLAAKLGKSVRELKATIGADEWLDWWVYYAREGQKKQLASGGSGG